MLTAGPAVTLISSLVETRVVPLSLIEELPRTLPLVHSAILFAVPLPVMAPPEVSAQAVPFQFK